MYCFVLITGYATVSLNHACDDKKTAAAGPTLLQYQCPGPSRRGHRIFFYFVTPKNSNLRNALHHIVEPPVSLVLQHLFKVVYRARVDSRVGWTLNCLI